LSYNFTTTFSTSVYTPLGQAWIDFIRKFELLDWFGTLKGGLQEKALSWIHWGVMLRADSCLRV
jgi:hypothetical protein